MFDHTKYITNEQKFKIEQISEHTRWGGYKNARFNLQLWETFWTEIFVGNVEDRILDYGCGGAWSLVVAKKLGYSNINAVDINTDEVMQQFNQWHKILNNDVDFWDGKTMPYETDYFNTIVAKASITKLCNSDWISFYSEMTRISKPGATWYIAPDYMFDRMPEKEKWLASKNINVVIWDWDRQHPCNDVFQPSMIDI